MKCIIHIILAAMTVGGTSVALAPVAPQHIEPGMLLQSFALEDLDGERKSLAVLRADAKLTVIVFWATWSESSLKELKQLAELDALQEKGLRVLAVNVEAPNPTKEQFAKIRETAAEFPPGFAVLLDKDLSTFRDYGVSAVPTTFLAGPSGLVVFRLAGFPVAGGARMLSYIRGTIQGNLTGSDPWSYRPDPRSARYYHLGRVLLGKGDRELAIHTLERAVEIDPEYMRPHALLGDMEKAAGRLDEALAHYSRALLLSPQEPQLLCESGECLLLAGKVVEGLDRIRRALAQESGDGLIHAHFGFGLALGGELSEARTEFALAVKLAPGEYRVQKLRARAYELAQMKAQAIAAYWSAYDLLTSGEQVIEKEGQPGVGAKSESDGDDSP